jgi:hypothetical protein
MHVFLLGAGAEILNSGLNALCYMLTALCFQLPSLAYNCSIARSFARSATFERNTVACRAASMPQQEQLPSILHSPESLRTLTLKDGRQVSLSFCGDPAGKPVFFLHPIQVRSPCQCH